MYNILAFGASSSVNSINRQLAQWAANQVEHATVKLLDLNDFEMPLYSIDREHNQGVPDEARRFTAAIDQADGIIISFAEHNGSYSAVFKNILDWISRLEKPIWSNKPMLLLATSPGPRGAQSVLSTATGSFPFQGGIVAGSFSLPSFIHNFDDGAGITEPSLNETFNEQLAAFLQTINEGKTELSSGVA